LPSARRSARRAAVFPFDRDDHEKTSYEIMRARCLMIELVGGEPAQQLCDQFA
jgi:hypothetical protein